MSRSRLLFQLSVMALAIAASVGAGVFARNATLVRFNPEQALQNNPRNGSALVSSITERLERNPSYALRSADVHYATNSLASNPLNEGTIRIIGTWREIKGDAAGAAHAMQLANRVSRRDVLNQLWLIEKSVESDDIKTAVRHYNNALITRSETGVILFPILSSAIVHPEIRTELRPYLQRQAAWAPAFLSVAASTGDPVAFAQLILPVAKSLAGEPYQKANALALHRLYMLGKARTASDLARQLWPDLSQTDLTKIALSPSSADTRLGMLGWTFPQTEGVDSSLDSEGALHVNVSPLARGRAAERDVVVTPGARYRISQHIRQENSGAKAEIIWSAYCVRPSGLTPLWNEKLPNISNAMVTASQFAVPLDCHLLRLSLAMRGPEGQSGAGVTVSALSLSRT